MYIRNVKPIIRNPLVMEIASIRFWDTSELSYITIKYRLKYSSSFSTKPLAPNRADFRTKTNSKKLSRIPLSLRRV